MDIISYTLGKRAASGGTTDHSVLSNRDIADQHPMSAITGLTEALSEKQSIINDIEDIRSGAAAGATAVQPAAEVTSGTSITLADNTEYRLSNVTTLTLAYPSGNFECWLRITTASSGTITITLPTSQYIGDTPTFAAGETWELSIKDGYVIAHKVGA